MAMRTDLREVTHTGCPGWDVPHLRCGERVLHGLAWGFSVTLGLAKGVSTSEFDLAVVLTVIEILKDIGSAGAEDHRIKCY